MSTPPGISTAHLAPVATFGRSASVVALDSISVFLTGAQVPGHPEAKFTYRFDCGDGKGYGAATTATFARCPTRVAGTRTVRAKVIDQDGDSAAYAGTVPVTLRPQTVSFTSTVPSAPVINTTYTVSAKSSSGLAITVTASPRTYCSSSGSIVTFVAMGICSIVADRAGDSTYASARATQTFRTIWPFSGFFSPVRNAPYVNEVTAGRYVKLPFSLGGNRGSNVVPSGTASTQAVTCDPNAVRIALTSAGVGIAGVVYDPGTARYVLTWKTDAAWVGTCRTVTITLADGTTHALRFAFN
jgi:hypothetical protein